MGRPFFYRNKIVSKSREQLSKKINPQPQDRKPACRLVRGRFVEHVLDNPEKR